MFLQDIFAYLEFNLIYIYIIYNIYVYISNMIHVFLINIYHLCFYRYPHPNIHFNQAIILISICQISGGVGGQPVGKSSSLP